MTIDVVELLEPVDIDHDQAKLRPGTPRTQMLPGEHLIESAAIGKTGETVLSSERPQSSIGLRELVLDGFARRDIAQGADDAIHFTGHRILQRAQLCFHPDPFAAVMADAIDDRLTLGRAAKQGLEYQSEPRRVLRVGHIDWIDAEQLFRFVTKQLPARRGDVAPYQVGVEAEYHVGGIVGKQPVTRLALLQVPFGLHALLDVADDQQALIPLTGDVDCASGSLDPDVAAVLALHPIAHRLFSFR